jgi:hypothetical protein
MQTTEETLFANRKTKEKNAPINLKPNTPLKRGIICHASPT